jgi:hypothetical protein
VIRGTNTNGPGDGLIFPFAIRQTIETKTHRVRVEDDGIKIPAKSL